MNNIFSVIFMNIWGYDMIIFITAVITAVVYIFLKISVDRLYDKIHKDVFVTYGTDFQIENISETTLQKMREKESGRYSIFVNLTGIFPLLGILGTVTSLLSLVADTSDITGNFYGALTSTFWGLIFAIIFKFLDGVISARIDENEKNIALYLERNFKTNPEKEKVLI